MKATSWEFTNRAFIFGLIFGVAFPLYAVDHQNGTAALADWLGARFQLNGDSVARLLFAIAAGFVIAAALIRTWASAYLKAGVVYASEVQTETLVADGPYRWVRNPLYLGNVLLAIGMGSLMSRVGFGVAVLAMLVFCYRLILREEAELEVSQGEHYARYRNAVPRLWPALRPRAPAAGHPARGRDGFKAEAWSWGFAAAVVGFAITLSTTVFFVILGASLLVFWVSSALLQKKSTAA